MERRFYLIGGLYLLLSSIFLKANDMVEKALEHAKP